MATKEKEPTRGELTARVCGKIGGIPRSLSRLAAELVDLRSRIAYAVKHKADAREITAEHIKQLKLADAAAVEMADTVESLRLIADIIDEDVNRLASK